MAPRRAVQVTAPGVRVLRRNATDSAGTDRSIGVYADRYALIRSPL